MTTVSKIFKPGDVVLNALEPFVIQINDNEIDNRCHYCLQVCAHLKTCGQCLSVQYCSKKCQLADWKDIHKFNECKLLKDIARIVITSDSRLMMRLILKITFDSKSKQKVYRLWDNRERKFGDLVDQLNKTVNKMEGIELFQITTHTTP